MTDTLPLTGEDLDEWIAHVRADRWDTQYVPNEWARSGLGALLGEPIPYRVWRKDELLATLDKARSSGGR